MGGLQHIPDSELEVMPWRRHGVSAGTAMISFSVTYPAHQAVLMPSLQLSLGPLIPPLSPSQGCYIQLDFNMAWQANWGRGTRAGLYHTDWSPAPLCPSV